MRILEEMPVLVEWVLAGKSGSDGVRRMLSTHGANLAFAKN
jgi:hypothetical protein